MKQLSALAIGLVLLFAAGCDTGDRISQLERENKDLKAELDKNRDTVTDYDLQAKCSKDAKTWFDVNWSGTRDADTKLLDYSNHYNKKQNMCFILVEYHYGEHVGASWMNDMTLWNVYENSKYGSFTENHIITFKSDARDMVLECEVYGAKCKTGDEFNNLIRPYLSD